MKIYLFICSRPNTLPFITVYDSIKEYNQARTTAQKKLNNTNIWNQNNNTFISDRNNNTTYFFTILNVDIQEQRTTPQPEEEPTPPLLDYDTVQLLKELKELNI